MAQLATPINNLVESANSLCTIMSDSDAEAIDCASAVDQIHAELVAKEKEALEIIKEDICKWLSRIILELKDISPSTFMEALDTGVALYRLVTLIQNSAATAPESGKKLNFTVPMAVLSCSVKAERGSFFARDNAANFISWCRELGVDETVIFESEGLVLHKDEKRVILCLLDVARYAERVGVSPPELVKMEREIEELEASGGETSPVPWNSDEVNKKEECAKTQERTSNTIDPVTLPSVQLDKELTPSTSNTTSEETVSPIDKERDSNTTITKTPEQIIIPLSQRTAHPVSARKSLVTPSRIPVPIRGTTRTHRVQNVQSSKKQLRKRKRDEQEEDEGRMSDEIYEAKKLKTSSGSISISVRENSLRGKKAIEEERTRHSEIDVQRKHESVDEKVH